MQENLLNQKNKNIFAHCWKTKKNDFAVNLRKQRRKNLENFKRAKFFNDKENSYCPIDFFKRYFDKDVSKIEEFIIIPELVSCLNKDNIEMTTDVCAVVCNLALNEINAEVIANTNYIQVCEEFLKLGYEELAENVVWSLANIAGNGLKFRKNILQTNFLYVFQEVILNQTVKIEFLTTAGWMLQNLIQGELGLSLELWKVLVLIIKEFILLNFLVLDENCLWILVQLTNFDYPKDLLCSEIVCFVNKYALDKDINFSLPACKIIGNILSGDTETTQFMIENSVLEVINQNLYSESSVIVKETCWAASNIIGGSFNQVTLVLTHLLMGGLVKCISHNDISVKKEASWAFSNLGIQAKNKIFDHLIINLVNLGIINELQAGFQCKDMEIIRNLTIFVEALMKSAENLQIDLSEQFLSLGLINSIEYSCLYCDKATEHKILNILEDYFGQENDLSDNDY